LRTAQQYPVTSPRNGIFFPPKNKIFFCCKFFVICFMVTERIHKSPINLVRSLSLPSFCIVASDEKWQLKPHLLKICNEIYNLLFGNKKVLIVNMPPRHGKSELISKYFPAWYLLNFPQNRVILSTYSDDFAGYFGRLSFEVYKSMMNYFNLGIWKKRQSANEWFTSQLGSMVSVGAGGSLTGRGANLILVDDPVKNVSEALSDLTKEGLNEWFSTTVLTRLEPNGKLILIMTRWQEDDLTGRLLKSLPSNKVIHLSLPAIDEKRCALWEERFPLAELLSIKELISPYWFNAMYQQEPSLKGNEWFNISYFKYFCFVDDNLFCRSSGETFRGIFLKKFGTMDLAISVKEGSDYTVCLSFFLDNNNNVFIDNIVSARIPPDKHENFAIEFFNNNKVICLGIESVAYQVSLIQRLLNLGIPIKSLIPEKSKEIRLFSMLPFLIDGKVYLLEKAVWIKSFLDELRSFPYGSHDDMVDAFSYIRDFIGSNSVNVNDFFSSKVRQIQKGF